MNKYFVALNLTTKMYVTLEEFETSDIHGAYHFDTEEMASSYLRQHEVGLYTIIPLYVCNLV